MTIRIAVVILLAGVIAAGTPTRNAASAPSPDPYPASLAYARACGRTAYRTPIPTRRAISA